MDGILFIFILLVVYQFKHFLADYPLQNEYMLGKFSTGISWVLPLATHSLVHASFTFLIALVATTGNPILWWVVLVDFVLHFTMDRLKASPNLLGRFKMHEAKFWWALGFDQMFHH
jgi:hypothetical protein